MSQVKEKLRTPWGTADSVQRVAEGVDIVSTPSHGGFKLSPSVNRRIPKPLRVRGGWYEEDCEWAIPVVVLSRQGLEIEPNSKARDAAYAIMRNYYPDEYERELNCSILPGKSLDRARQEFVEDHQGDWVAVSATGRTRPFGPEIPGGFVLVTACRGGWYADPACRQERRQYFVPDAEYAERSHFGFVVDPDRHRRVEEAPA